MTLPSGWSRVRVGDVLDVKYGKALPPTKRTEHGRFPIVGSAGPMPLRTMAPLTDRPAIIIGRKGSVGTVTYESSGCWPVDTTYYLEPPTSVFEPRFLEHHLRQLDLRQLDSSTTVPSLRRQDLESQTLALPPLAEQRRIVDILEDHLSRLDAAMAGLSRSRLLSESLVTSTLREGLRGRLPVGSPVRESGAECIPLGAAVDRAEFGPDDRTWEVPTDWCWTRIGLAFSVSVGTTPSRREPELWSGDLPWVSSGEVSFNRITATRESIMRTNNGSRVARSHPPGTVMLAMIGEGKTRGQAAILDIEAAHNQNCASIRTGGADVIPEYLYAFLRERYLVTRRAASGGNQPALNKRLVEAIPIPIPPKSVQERLVRIFEDRSAATALLIQDLTKTELAVAALRASLLAAAFSGRLTGRSSDLDLAEELVSV